MTPVHITGCSSGYGLETARGARHLRVHESVRERQVLAAQLVRLTWGLPTAQLILR